MEQDNLTAIDKQKLQNIELARGGVALLGVLSGVLYANRTGGKFLRYVGWGLAGAMLYGTTALVISTPFKNRILTKSEQKTQTGEE